MLRNIGNLRFPKLMYTLNLEMYTFFIDTMREVFGCGTWYGNEDDCMRSIYGWSGKDGVEDVGFIWRWVGEWMGLYLGTPTYTQGINILVIVENG